MRRPAIPIALFVAALAAAGAAHGELAQSGNLRVAFGGGISPHVLPRESLAPVTAHIESSFHTLDGGRPPQLRSISIAINRSGRLYFRGLPNCDRAAIVQTSTEAALAACRGALVGHGRFAANVHFPTVTAIPARGKALLFIGRAGGQPAILLHVYGTSPIRFTFVIPFAVRRLQRGDFGTVLSARIPRIASDFGYVTDLELTIGRRYSYGGRPRSFLSASCAAPPGFPGAIFDLARGSFSFSNGQRLTTTLVRHCKVR